MVARGRSQRFVKVGHLFQCTGRPMNSTGGGLRHLRSVVRGGAHPLGGRSSGADCSAGAIRAVVVQALSRHARRACGAAQDKTGHNNSVNLPVYVPPLRAADTPALSRPHRLDLSPAAPEQVVGVERTRAYEQARDTRNLPVNSGVRRSSLGTSKRR